MNWTSANYYKIVKNSEMNLSSLSKALTKRKMRDLTEQELHASGFVEFDNKSLVSVHRNFLVFRLQTASKVIPNAVIKGLVQEEIEKLSQISSVNNKQKRLIKEEIISSLIPKAFITKTFIHAAIDIEQNILIIANTSESKCLNVISELREAFNGNFSTIPLISEGSLIDVLTKMVKNSDNLTDFELMQECELKNFSQDSSVLYKKHDLNDNFIKTQLNHGYKVCKLALNYQNSISFKIKDDWTISSLSILQDDDNDEINFLLYNLLSVMTRFVQMLNDIKRN